MALTALCLLGAGGGTLFSLPYIVAGKRSSRPDVQNARKTGTADHAAKETLTVMTLNMAHGGPGNLAQFLQGETGINENIRQISTLIDRHRPNVVALQEADGPSGWSGSFNHVGRIASRTGLSYSVRGEHVDGMSLSYGTALLCDRPLDDPLSVTFKPAPPLLCKGFVVSSIDVPDLNTPVDVVSVHLDFLRDGVRRSQIQELIQKLNERGRPVIVMGDFNSGWDGDGRALQLLTAELDLQAFKPQAPGLHTFPRFKKRLDWILVSPELSFESYEVVPAECSDHHAVVARVRLQGNS